MSGHAPNNFPPLPVLPVSAAFQKFLLCIILLLISLAGIYVYCAARSTEFLHRERIAASAVTNAQFKVTLKPRTTTAFLVLGSKNADSLLKAHGTICVADFPEKPGVPEPISLGRSCTWLDAEQLSGCIVKDLRDHVSFKNGAVVWVTLPSGLPGDCELWLVSTRQGK